MAMMKCPHCNADNSDKREYCYQCDGALRGKAKETHGYLETCRSCAKANMFPPPGIVLSSDQVWCLEKDEVLSGARIAGECFEEAFGWNRNKILD
jgi:hypothetical protein